MAPNGTSSVTVTSCNTKYDKYSHVTSATGSCSVTRGPACIKNNARHTHSSYLRACSGINFMPNFRTLPARPCDLTGRETLAPTQTDEHFRILKTSSRYEPLAEVKKMLRLRYDHGNANVTIPLVPYTSPTRLIYCIKYFDLIHASQFFPVLP